MHKVLYHSPSSSSLSSSDHGIDLTGLLLFTGYEGVQFTILCWVQEELA